MIKMNENNWDQFDTYILTKGYEYYKTDTDENFEIRTYAFGVKQNKSYYFITKTIGKGNSIRMFTIQTVKKQDYLFYKEEVKKYKFVYIKSQTEGNSIIMEYKKGNSEVWISSILNMDAENKKVAGYEISIKTE